MTLQIGGAKFLADPQSQIAKLQDQGPFVRARIPIFGPMWVATTDEACRAVLKDKERFRRNSKEVNGKPMEKLFWFMPRAMRPLMQNLLLKDGEEHARLRGLVEDAFRRIAVEDMEDDITAIADGLLDRIEDGRPIDIITSYSRELPFQVICRMLGVPPEDWPFFAKNFKPLSSARSLFSAMWATTRLGAVTRKLRGYFQGGPDAVRDGLIRELLQSHQDSSGLTEDELLAMVLTLFVAGHETTVHLINNAIVNLCEDPSIAQSLRADPSGTAIYLEEVMRFFSPVQMTKMLFVTKDGDYMGVNLRKGDKVLALLAGANHDPQRHDSPSSFVPDRRPNAHLGFGSGIHVCLGMQLARTEAKIAIDQLLARFDRLELAEPVVWSKRLGINGPRKLRLKPRR